jgi:hypothetical protein
MVSSSGTFQCLLCLVAYLLLVENSSALKLINSKLKLGVLFSSRGQGNTAASTDESADRTFASYVVYKSKAAVSLKMIPPTFQPVGTRSRTVSRDGGLLLEFAAASGN